MSLDLSIPEVEFAVNAVRRVALLAERVQDGIEVRGIQKSDLSPVTVADYAGQAVVGKALSEAFPGAVLVGEEDASDLRTAEGQATAELVAAFVKDLEPEASPEQVCDWIDLGNGDPCGRFWTLDPIDGTKGYLRKEQYAIALALVEAGQVKIGVLGCPKLGAGCALDAEGKGILVVAVRDRGAWWCPLDRDSPFERLRVSGCEDIRDARLLRSVESGHTNVGKIDSLSRALGLDAAPVSLDSQAKYAVLGSGGGEILLRLLSSSKPDYKEKIWDQAAGSIVVEEAGGRVTDLEGRPLDFTRGRTLAGNTGICATNGLLHEQVLEAIGRLG